MYRLHCTCTCRVLYSLTVHVYTCTCTLYLHVRLLIHVSTILLQVTCSESSFPLHLTSSWTCDQSTTLVKINYSYTPSVFPTNKKPVLSNGTITVTVGGGVTQHTLEPLGVWQSEKNLAGWKLEPLDPSNDPGNHTFWDNFNYTCTCTCT